jgi:large subunit ribosomal protein L19
MAMNAIMQKIEAKSLREKPFSFDIGDTVDVHVRTLEGDKERLQVFSGLVIARRGSGTREYFTVRRIVEGEGVERAFPTNSPRISDVVVKRRSKVRRAKLYFIRDRVGKQAYRLKERPMNQATETTEKKQSRKGRKAKEQIAAAKAAANPDAVKKAKKEKKKAPRAKKAT